MGFMPNDGYKLISTTDIAGPYKTLERAREVFKEKVINWLGQYETIEELKSRFYNSKYKMKYTYKGYTIIKQQ